MKILASTMGKVYLVGAGPGDPELLTLKAARCLGEADIVIYDRLVDRRILYLAPNASELICVGKKGGHYNFPQHKINQLLAVQAHRGHQVVRLKGGDLFLFGRGGEEAVFLAEQKIPFEIVPGVTSAVAVPAAAGIPPTHRGCASSVAIVTGHGKNYAGDPIRWEHLSKSVDTLIVLMPLRNLRHIVNQLILHGRSLNTPSALIESGTLETQKQVVAPLRTIVSKSIEIGIKSPALLVVGSVVNLSELLSESYSLATMAEWPSGSLKEKMSS